MNGVSSIKVVCHESPGVIKKTLGSQAVAMTGMMFGAIGGAIGGGISAEVASSEPLTQTLHDFTDSNQALLSGTIGD